MRNPLLSRLLPTITFAVDDPFLSLDCRMIEWADSSYQTSLLWLVSNILSLKLEAYAIVKDLRILLVILEFWCEGGSRGLEGGVVDTLSS